MTKTSRLHFGLKIMSMKEDFFDYHGNYGVGRRQDFKRAAAATGKGHSLL